MTRIALPLLFVCLSATQAARAEGCALALALAMDVSSSVNAAEYEIQKGGLAAALRNDDVQAAIRRAPDPVQVLVYEWSGVDEQVVIVDWRRLRSAGDLDALAADLDRHRRVHAQSGTAIGAALAFGARQFNRLDRICDRRVIDISGDGAGNAGPPARAATLDADIIVNALVIKGATPDPERRYRDEVVRGPGAFLVVARNGFEDYADLILGKLLREIEPRIFIGALVRDAQ